MVAAACSTPASAQKPSKREQAAQIEQLMRTVEMLAAKVDSLQREVDNRVPVGTLYYDTTVGKARCYTEQGWRYLAFE